MGCRKKRARATRIGASWAVNQRLSRLTKAVSAEPIPARQLRKKAVAWLASHHPYPFERTSA